MQNHIKKSAFLKHVSKGNDKTVLSTHILKFPMIFYFILYTKFNFIKEINVIRYKS